MASLNTGRYQAGVAAFKNKIWAAGGSDAWNCLSSVETYDPDTDKWTYSSSLLTPRRGCGLAEFNGRLYAVGGTDGTHSLSSTEMYDEENQTWVFGPSLTTPRSNVSVASVFGKLYAIGGFAGKSFLNTMEYLDPNTNEWTTFIRQQGDNQSAIIEQQIVEKLSELHATVANVNDLGALPPCSLMMDAFKENEGDANCATIPPSNGRKLEQNGRSKAVCSKEQHAENGSSSNGNVIITSTTTTNGSVLAAIEEHIEAEDNANGARETIS